MDPKRYSCGGDGGDGGGGGLGSGGEAGDDVWLGGDDDEDGGGGGMSGGGEARWRRVYMGWAAMVSVAVRFVPGGGGEWL